MTCKKKEQSIVGPNGERERLSFIQEFNSSGKLESYTIEWCRLGPGTPACTESLRPQLQEST